MILLSQYVEFFCWQLNGSVCTLYQRSIPHYLYGQMTKFSISFYIGMLLTVSKR